MMKWPWDKRSTLSMNEFLQDTAATPENARRLSDRDLHWSKKQLKHREGALSVVEAEIRRREGAIALYALWISLASLLVAALALFVD